MTAANITWANLPEDRRLFVVLHEGVPLPSCVLESDVLYIPDKWNHVLCRDRRYLLTEAERSAWGFDGKGVAVACFPKLDDGDVVLWERGHDKLEVVYQVQSSTNSLYVTNACNSRCKFCPQPSTPDDGRLYNDAEWIIDHVASPGKVINVTGGEPTIKRRRFIDFLRHATEKWPATKTFLLTNGRNFKDGDFVDEIFDARGESQTGFGIPLYADSAVVHDSVVGVPGAFGETMRGLYALAVHRPEIEIRFVVSRLSYKRLPNLVEFVGKNIPFVSRIAVMGLEPMGFCRELWDDFWVDPEDCGEQLLQAANAAGDYGLDMMLYNFQICCIPEQLRAIACSSISEWKRVFIPDCLCCAQRCRCGGFFASQNSPKYLPRKFGKNKELRK